jgi:hypothetical protein
MIALEIVALLGFLVSAWNFGFYAYILGSLWQVFDIVFISSDPRDIFINSLPILLLALSAIFLGLLWRRRLHITLWISWIVAMVLLIASIGMGLMIVFIYEL